MGSPEIRRNRSNCKAQPVRIDQHSDQENRASHERLRRNAGALVKTIVDSALMRTPHKAVNNTAVSQLVESIVWPFVSRLSSRDGAWLSPKEFTELGKSVDHMVVVVDKYIDNENREQSFLKFHLDSLLFKAFEDPSKMVPPRDSWNVDRLFVGWCHRFVQRALARHDVSFIYSLQKGSKKGWPAMGLEKLAASYKKHSERFGKSHGDVISQDLSEEIKAVSKKVFAELPNSDFTKFIPRGSACLQRGRREGGALSLFEDFQFPGPTDEAAVGKLRSLNADLEGWRRRNFDVTYAYVEQRLLGRNPPYPRPRDESLEEYEENTNQCSYRKGIFDLDIQGIAEPGKYRIISKGDGYLYSCLQPFQGAILDCWKKRQESTMLRDDLTQRMNEMADATRDTPLEFWASVDYEAATDLVKQDATYLAMSGAVDAPFFDLAWKSLSNGVARYPEVSRGKKGQKDYELIQKAFQVNVKDAQPMGHPLSFPLLCIINLAVYRTAVRRWIRQAPAFRIHWGQIMFDNVLVNGDDMLFKCSEDFYPIFNAVAAEAGFKISIGKQYLSRKCAMINSQLFQQLTPVSKVLRRGYLNLNIVKGVSVKKTSDVEATPTQISRDANKMISLCKWARSSIPAIMERWTADWFGKRFQPNWFLPVHLGGCGFERELAPPGNKITRAQRYVAACYIDNPKLQLYRRKGMDIPTLKYAMSLLEYKMFPSSMNYVKSETEVLADREGDKWLGKICYASRVKNGSVELESDCVFANNFLTSKNSRTGRLKPVNFSTLDTYHEVITVASFKVPCPPSAPLTRHRMPRSSEVSRVPLQFSLADLRSGKVTGKDIRMASLALMTSTSLLSTSQTVRRSN